MILPFNDIFAITGGHTSLQVDQHSIRSSNEEFSLIPLRSTSDNEQSDVTDRKLIRKERKLTRRINRFNKLLAGPTKPKKPTKNEPSAIVSFITGVAGLLLLVAPFGLALLGVIACIVAIVFGAISLKKFKLGLNNGGGRGLGLAGMICGIVGVALAVLVIAFLVALFGRW